MQDFLFTINIIGPIFIIILIGFFIKKIKLIDETFINTSSKVVFNVAFPALIFIKISQTEFPKIAQLKELLFGVVGILITFIITLLIGLIFVKDKTKKGVFTQGAFRGNYAIFGLAIMFNLFGDEGISKAAIILAASLPLFNVLAIIGLVLPMHKLDIKGLKTAGFKIITNPNIIAVIVALVFSYFKIPVGKIKILNESIRPLAQIALPMALIGIGGSLSFKNIKENLFLVISATVIKIIIFPVIFTFIAYFFGFRKQSLVALFLLFGVPTAVTSYIFAKALGGDSKLAANIVLLTTLGAILTIAVGIYILKVNNMIY